MADLGVRDGSPRPPAARVGVRHHGHLSLRTGTAPTTVAGASARSPRSGQKPHSGKPGLRPVASCSDGDDGAGEGGGAGDGQGDPTEQPQGRDRFHTAGLRGWAALVSGRIVVNRASWTPRRPPVGSDEVGDSSGTTRNWSSSAGPGSVGVRATWSGDQGRFGAGPTDRSGRRSWSSGPGSAGADRQRQPG